MPARSFLSGDTYVVRGGEIEASFGGRPFNSAVEEYAGERGREK